MSVFPCVCVCVAVCVFPCVWPCVFPSVCVRVCVSVSVGVCVCFHLCACVCVFPSVWARVCPYRESPPEDGFVELKQHAVDALAALPLVEVTHDLQVGVRQYRDRSLRSR